jgi:signal transduction histidine kinase
LQQLLQNIIGNALKYSKPGVPPEIVVASRVIKADDTLVSRFPSLEAKLLHFITVKDNGIGFEQQYAEQIFEIFKRLHGKAEYSGTGIGLSIVRKAVENHHGHIWAEGEPGYGATFYIVLPAA